MATELSPLAKYKSLSPVQKPSIILKIAGIDTVFGVGKIKKYIKIGDPDLLIGDDWLIGGFNLIEDQSDIISLDGTTTTISQQLLQDKGGTSSISSINISLLDINGEMTQLVTPGLVVDEILGRKADLYLGYADTAYPQDYIRIFSGLISDIDSGSTVVLTIAHPEQKKRGEIFQKAQTVSTAEVLFNADDIEGLRFSKRRDVVSNVSIEKIAGGVSGSEVITVVGNAITIQVEVGVSTADGVKKRIYETSTALSLINLEVLDGAVLQTVTPLTVLGSDLVVNVESTSSFLSPAPPYFRTYIKVDDEVMEYTGKTSTSFTGITRAALESFDPRARGDNHEAEVDVESFYRIQGNAFDLALFIMMSRQGLPFAEDVQISSVLQVEGIGNVAQAVYFTGRNIQDDLGLVPGDLMTITDEDNPLNDHVDAVIASIEVTQFGSYVTLTDDFPLYLTTNSSGLASFKSKYDVFPEGASLQMGGDEVDVPRFEQLKDLYAASIFEYDLFIKDTVSAKDFIDTTLLFPSGAYTLPRKGKVSAGYTAPPLAIDDLTVLDESNVAQPQNNVIRRSISRYFYNTVLFKFDQLVVDDSFRKGRIETDAESRNKIKVGNKVLNIEAPGIRSSSENLSKMSILSKRMLERYRLGAENIRVKGFYGPTFANDVGDIVLFGSQALNLVDTKSGTRDFAPRLWEVVNKSMDIKTGDVTMELVDTSYLVDGRYGIWSPASIVGTGSTTTRIKVVNSYGWDAPKIETGKWTNYVGLEVRVHNDDWTFDETVTLMSLDPSDQTVLVVDPPLSVAPAAGLIVDIAEYDDFEASAGAAYKTAFCFFDPQVEVTVSVDDQTFEVSPTDIGKFIVGATVLVHNDDYTVVSPELEVDSILGNQVTLSDVTGFTIPAGYFIDLIGFTDGGPAYRFL